jgi:precorrin-2 dehydrogenase/sirohydrochlorin ferrochelatase
VRRGKLLLTVSTGGTAPGAAARIRADLEQRFDADWGARLEAIAAARAAWRTERLPPSQVARNVASLMEARGWVPPHAAPAAVAEVAGSTINAF